MFVLYHPFILYRLSGVGSRREQSTQESPDFPLPSDFIQLLQGDPKVFPGQFSIVPLVFRGTSYC